MFEKMDGLFESGLVRTAVYSAIVLSAAYFISFIIGRIIRRRENSQDRERPSVFLRLVRVFIYAIAIYSIISRIKPLQSITRAMLTSTSVIAVVVSIAAQDTVGNLVAGISILTTHPFRKGDLVKVGSSQQEIYIGFVEKIAFQHTIIRTYQNVYIAVPNSYIIRNPIINENLIDPRKSSYFEITISYDSDIDYAMNFIKERLKKDERVLDRDDIDVSCVRLESNGAVIRTVIAARTSYDAFDIETDLRKAIFKEISIHHGFAIAPARIEIVKHQH